jgi:hypothetical protein
MKRVKVKLKIRPIVEGWVKLEFEEIALGVVDEEEVQLVPPTIMQRR